VTDESINLAKIITEKKGGQNYAELNSDSSSIGDVLCGGDCTAQSVDRSGFDRG
jgi:hypothetical protein